VTTHFSLGSNRGHHLVNLFSQETLEADPHGAHRVTLEPHGYRWYRVGGLDYILQRRLD
jgi:maltose alpha-D-glucosyltransferase/alpha-amylase